MKKILPLLLATSCAHMNNSDIIEKPSIQTYHITHEDTSLVGVAHEYPAAHKSFHVQARYQNGVLVERLVEKSGITHENTFLAGYCGKDKEETFHIQFYEQFTNEGGNNQITLREMRCIDNDGTISRTYIEKPAQLIAVLRPDSTHRYTFIDSQRDGCANFALEEELITNRYEKYLSKDYEPEWKQRTFEIFHERCHPTFEFPTQQLAAFVISEHGLIDQAQKSEAQDDDTLREISHATPIEAMSPSLANRLSTQGPVVHERYHYFYSEDILNGRFKEPMFKALSEFYIFSGDAHFTDVAFDVNQNGVADIHHTRCDKGGSYVEQVMVDADEDSQPDSLRRHEYWRIRGTKGLSREYESFDTNGDGFVDRKKTSDIKQNHYTHEWVQMRAVTRVFRKDSLRKIKKPLTPEFRWPEWY